MSDIKSMEIRIEPTYTNRDDIDLRIKVMVGSQILQLNERRGIGDTESFFDVLWERMGQQLKAELKNRHNLRDYPKTLAPESPAKP